MNILYITLSILFLLIIFSLIIMFRGLLQIFRWYETGKK